MNISEPVKLHFEDSGNWYSLPDWAEFFINLGHNLASDNKCDSRVVTAIVLPTRAFATAFVSLGMVFCDSARRNLPKNSAHFENLFDLQPGVHVIYHHSNERALKGILVGPKEIDGKFYLGVQVHSKSGGGRTYFIDENKAHTVQLARHSGKLPKKQDGPNLRLANRFVDGLLGIGDPVQLGIQSKICCALVGRRPALEQEIRRTPIAIYANGDYHSQGILQDVLRVDRFVSENQSYRSVLFPVGSSPPPADIVDKVEMGVIFDGAIGFLKWNYLWNRNNIVVVLDKTEMYLNDAVSSIKNRFIQNRLVGERSMTLTTPPAGCEVLCFREKIQ